jgi:hypothetical protein
MVQWPVQIDWMKYEIWMPSGTLYHIALGGTDILENISPPSSRFLRVIGFHICITMQTLFISYCRVYWLELHGTKSQKASVTYPGSVLTKTCSASQHTWNAMMWHWSSLRTLFLAFNCTVTRWQVTFSLAWMKVSMKNDVDNCADISVKSWPWLKRVCGM